MKKRTISKMQRKRTTFVATIVAMVMCSSIVALATTKSTSYAGTTFKSVYTSSVGLVNMSATSRFYDAGSTENAYYCKTTLNCISEAGTTMSTTTKYGLDDSGKVSDKQSYWYGNSSSKTADHWSVTNKYSPNGSTYYKVLSFTFT